MSLDTTDFAEGRLVAQLATATTTGVTLQAIQVNGEYVTFPTGQFYLMIKRKTDTSLQKELVNVASGTTMNSTTGVVTLGTLTRNLSGTDGSDTTGTAATIVWPAGTLCYIGVTTHEAENWVKKGEANTFTSLQTFSAGADFTGTTRPPKFPSYTTAERDALTPETGMNIINTDEGTEQTYYGGQWNDAGTSTTANGSTTVAGKYEEATVAEQGTATATGATGARLVVANANLVKTSSGAGDENKIAVLGASGTLAVGFLSTGTPDGTKFVRDDGALATPTFTSTDFVKNLYQSTGNSTAITAIGETVFDTLTPSDITANDLIAGVSYEIEGIVDISAVAGGSRIGLQIGGASFIFTSTSSTVTGGVHFRAVIWGTEAAGAAAAVKGSIMAIGGAAHLSGYASPNRATNGALSIRISGWFVSSGSMILRSLTVKRVSTTAA